MAVSAGVYTLGNDAVIAWVIPMTRSFRRHNPDVPLTVIAFDDRTDRLRALLPHDVDVWTPPSTPQFDAAGAELYPTQPTLAHMFRKFGAFEGPYDRFLYLDADVVVVRSLEPLLAVVQDDHLLVADLDENYVFLPPFREEMRFIGSRSFNAGFFGATKRPDIAADLTSTVAAIRPHWEHCVRAGDQPVLNYWATTHGLRTTTIAENVRASRSSWANQNLWGSPLRNSWGEMYFVHWAGFRVGPSMPNAKLYHDAADTPTTTRLAWAVARPFALARRSVRRRVRRAKVRLARRLRVNRASS